MNKGGLIFGLIGVVALGALFCSVFTALTGNTTTFDLVDGFQMSNPVAQAEATRVSLQAEAEAEANYAALQATRAAHLAQIQATATAMPYQAEVARQAANTAMARDWALVISLGGVLLAGVAGAFAIVAWMRTRARVVWNGANGPVVLLGDTLVDVGKAIGPAITVPPDDKLLELGRAVHYLQTGQIITKPAAQVQLTDGGASSELLLAAAQASATANTARQVFRPDNADSRGQKIKDMRQGILAPPQVYPALPAVRIVEDDSEVQLLLASEGE